MDLNQTASVGSYLRPVPFFIYPACKSAVLVRNACGWVILARFFRFFVACPAKKIIAVL